MLGQSSPLKSGYRYTSSIVFARSLKTIRCSSVEIGGLVSRLGVGSATVVAGGTVAIGMPWHDGGTYTEDVDDSVEDASGVDVAMSAGEAVSDGTMVGTGVAVDSVKACVTVLHDRVNRRKAIKRKRFTFMSLKLRSRTSISEYVPASC